jgi:hypothetical protein
MAPRITISKAAVAATLYTGFIVVILIQVLFRTKQVNHPDHVAKNIVEEVLGGFVQKSFKGASKMGAETTEETPVRILDVASSNSSARRRPTFLWGIASVFESDLEERRRNVIRHTYLSFYMDNSIEPNRICSLLDVIQGKIDMTECQLAYVFVMGGNPEGPKELVEHNETWPLLVVHPPNTEEDAVYLNIQENQLEGKMQTWFTYASTLAGSYGFHYIVKADSDTMLYPKEFFRMSDHSLPTNPERVYAGVPVYRRKCGDRDDEHCNAMMGKYYIGGQVEILSSDLATYISTISPEKRATFSVPHEDITIGNFVHSNPLPIQLVEFENLACWEHGKRNKDPGSMIYNWMVYERTETARRDTGKHPTMGLVNLGLGGKACEHFKLSCHSSNNANRERLTSKFWTHGESVLSKQTVLELIHDKVFPKEDTLESVDAFLWVVQDPVDRMLVSLLQKSSATPCFLSIGGLAIALQQLTFPSLIDQSNNYNCTGEYLASLISGQDSSKKDFSFNYKYFYQKTVKAFPDKKLFVLRKEFLSEDWQQLSNDFLDDTGKSYLQPSLEAAQSNLRISYSKILCCILLEELFIYAEVLKSAENLNPATVNESLERLSARCGGLGLNRLKFVCSYVPGIKKLQTQQLQQEITGLQTVTIH